MAYEWVAPTAGAVTGIAGIFFGWLTSRTSAHTQQALLSTTHMHDSDKARRQEMRDAFVALLAQVAKVDDVVLPRLESTAYSSSRYHLTASLVKEGREVTRATLLETASFDDKENMRTFVDAILAALRGFDAQSHEVQLVASESVVKAMYDVRADFLDICEEIAGFGNLRPLRAEKRTALINAMRGDLGYVTN